MDSQTINLLLGIGGIVGTLAGAVAGYIGATKAVKAQLDHADRTRFHEDRLAASVAFLEAIRRHVNLMFSARDRLDQPATPEELAQLGAIGIEINVALERLKLLASKEVNRLADDLFRFCCPINKTLGGKATKESLDQFSRTYQSKRAALHEAVRKELGVPVSAA